MAYVTNSNNILTVDYTSWFYGNFQRISSQICVNETNSEAVNLLNYNLSKTI